MAIQKKSVKNDPGKFAVTRKGLWLMAAGVAVMALGYVLLSGGGSRDPEVFNYAMFNFRRLTLAPVLIVAGIATEIVAIMKVFRSE